jgi:hypothetical protein
VRDGGSGRMQWWFESWLDVEFELCAGGWRQTEFRRCFLVGLQLVCSFNLQMFVLESFWLETEKLDVKGKRS